MQIKSSHLKAIKVEIRKKDKLKILICKFKKILNNQSQNNSKVIKPGPKEK